MTRVLAVAVLRITLESAETREGLDDLMVVFLLTRNTEELTELARIPAREI